MIAPDPSPAQERVLVLMPTVRDAERTAALLADARVQTAVCADLSALCRELRAGAAAVLVTDDAILGDTFGLLAETLRGHPPWSAVPVVVMTREGAARHVQRASEAVHGFIVVERPVRTRTLLSVVLSALRGRRHQYQIRDAILARERQAAALKAQEEKLRFALSAGALGAWDVDLTTWQLECSDLCRVNFGRRPDEPFTYEDLRAATHPADRERVGAAVERSASTGAEYDIEYRILWPDGETHWVLGRGRVAFDPQGRPAHLIGVSLDITEDKRMHEALQASRAELARQAEQLRSADRRKDEFLATLAHELRNPLAPIRTGVDLLNSAPAPPVAQRALGVMGRQLTHMVRLIDDLLDVSRITRGKLELKRERVSLGAVLDAAVEASRPFVDRGRHALRVSVADKGVLLDADPTRLAQVVSNLLNNASKYTQAGGSIELVATNDEDSVSVEVRDNGMGIPADRLDDVFEMFSQVNSALERTQGGLGIGLALVRSLVHMHGGTVCVASAGPDKGSVFSVHLPRSKTLSRVDESPAYAGAGRHGARRRVLVVDDNRDAADLLGMMLEQAGYDPAVFYDGRTALDSVAAVGPEIAILDIGLPEMDGYAVARALRMGESEGAAPLGLVALTGWGSRGDKEKAARAGFDVHLTKPIDAAGLRAALEGLELRVRGDRQRTGT